ncbi:hypothetical protein ABZ915_41380 [Streptomyces sp. NPDC046915]|uniref:hypothetical protein n=1 Tax=Streptomyces sp. NPDC046915 TaxID=3155257 RepID=UPI0033F89CEF
MPTTRTLRRPSRCTGAALLTAAAIVGTGVALTASGTLNPTAAHRSPRTDRVQVAAAETAAKATVPAGTRYYATADMSGESGTVTDGTSYTLTCRTDTGVAKPVVGIVIPGIGEVYVPGSSAPTPSGGIGLRPCPTDTSSDPAPAPGKYAAEDCAKWVSTQKLMEDFVKEWISNNAETWAEKLTAKGDPATPAPAGSPMVTDALSNASDAFYDKADAFLSAFRDALKDYPETYEDCQKQAEGADEPEWEDDGLAHMEEEGLSDELREWLETAVDETANLVADAAKNGVGSDDCAHSGTSSQC